MPYPERRTRRRLVFTALQLLTLLAAAEADACPNCATSATVWSGVLANDPGSMLGILSFAFCVVATLIALTARFIFHSRLFGGSLLLGAGLGAFLDGIALHQVLQWHAMLSSVIEPLDLVSSKVNMFWDGVFHLYAWAATVAAITIVVREVPYVRPEVRGRTMTGGAIAGWGLFNVVEGVISHQMFGLHHLHPGSHELAWDIGFLAAGVLLIAGGVAVAAPVLKNRTAAVPRTTAALEYGAHSKG